MKMMVFTALITLIIATGLCMFFTGTFKQAPPKGNASPEPEETVIQDTQGEGGEPQAQTQIQEQKQAQTQTQAQAQIDQQDTEDLEAKKMQATLARYKAQIASSEAELADIKAEIESLNSLKMSINRSQQLAKVYGSMKPDSAATVLCQLDEAFTEQILSEMNFKDVGKIMDAIADENPGYCVKLSKIMGESDKT